MLNPRRMAIIAAVATAAVLTLGACAPHTPSHHGGTHSGGGGTSGGSSSTPSSTPTPVAVAPPKIRIPDSCQQIAPAAEVTTVMGVTETLNTTDQLKDTPWLDSDLETYGYTEDGALVCNYSTASPSDLSFYRAYVMPDATQALWAPYFSQLSAPSSFNITPSPYGANSNLNCESRYHMLDCGLEMLIGSTWVSLYGNSDDKPVVTIAQAAAEFEPLFNSTVNAIKAATIAEPAWKDPAATSVSLSGDTASLNQALNTQLGATVSTQDYSYGPEVEESTDYALIPVHFDFYSDYVGNDALNIKVLPQGSWAWSAIVAKASTAAHYTTVTGIGDQAISYSQTASSTPYEAVVEVEKGHNVYSVEVDTTNAADGAAVLTVATKAAKVIATFIG
jgi:hypothetical protein